MSFRPKSTGKILALAVGMTLAAFGFAEAQGELSAINDRTNELEQQLKDNSTIPKDPFALEQEYRRVEAEIDRYTMTAAWDDRAQFQPSSVDEVIGAYKKLAEKIKGIKCEQNRMQEFATAITDFTSTAYQMGEILSKGNEGAFAPKIYFTFFALPGIGTATPSVGPVPDCLKVKEFFDNPNSVEAVTSELNTVKTRMSERSQALQNTKTAAAKLVRLLKQRRDALQQALPSASPQQSLANLLPYLLAIIGLASLGAMLVIRMFPSEIEMEWVASGQVIQFVTVMILLSAIMALGLSNILHENTLGTLLGGIAGYILAQGVGRAAAREVSRRGERDAALIEAQLPPAPPAAREPPPPPPAAPAAPPPPAPPAAASAPAAPAKSAG